jgi:hypothetical protein
MKSSDSPEIAENKEIQSGIRFDPSEARSGPIA